MEKIGVIGPKDFNTGLLKANKGEVKRGLPPISRRAYYKMLRNCVNEYDEMGDRKYANYLKEVLIGSGIINLS